MKNKMIELSMNGNRNIGFLSFFESNKEVPFDIKRIYYIYDMPQNTKRGMHAHKELQQLMWCPYGEVEVILDSGTSKKIFNLNSPNKALLIVNGDWRDFYSKQEGSVLIVAASDYYNEEDYIRDYDEFIEYTKEGRKSNENQF